MNIKNLILSILIVLFNGCIEPYTLDEEPSEKLLVVDGIVSDHHIRHEVKLTYTAPFGLNEEFNPLVFGAQVTLQDDQGLKLAFEPSGPGKYRLATPFAAEAGRCYQLIIILSDGAEYRSSFECLNPAVPIDSAYYEIREVIRYDPANNAYRSIEFPIYVNAEDPEESRNYYFWDWSAAEEMLTQPPCCPEDEFALRRCWLKTSLKRNHQVVIDSDRFFNGNKFSQEVYALPYDRSSQFLITIYQYTLTAGAFRFRQQVKQESKRSGSLFEPAPATIKGNIECIADPEKTALGYFTVAGRSSYRLLVKRQVKGVNPNFTRPVGDCLEVYPEATSEKPEGFE